MRAYALLGVVMLLWAGNSIVGRAVRGRHSALYARLRAVDLRFADPVAVRRAFGVAGPAALLAGWKVVLVLGVLGVGHVQRGAL